MTERHEIRDFAGLTGALLALLVLVIPRIEGMPGSLVAAALILRENMSLVFLASGLAFLAAVFNLSFRGRIEWPRFLYWGPFLTLLSGGAVLGIYRGLDRILPEEGVAFALYALPLAAKASPDIRLLWVSTLVGALIALWGGLAYLKEELEDGYGALIVLYVLFCVSSELSPSFMNLQYLLEALRQISCTGIIALGMTFVVVSGGIDLSAGALTVLLGTAMLKLWNAGFGGRENELLMSFCIFLSVVGMGAMLGLVAGFTITKMRLPSFIVTLSAMAAYRALTLYAGGFGISDLPVTLPAVIGMGTDPLLNVPYPVWAFLSLSVLCGTLLARTRFGRYAIVVGANEKAALYAGINADRVRALSYLIVGILSAVSAFFLAARSDLPLSMDIGIDLELDAIAAVLIGGTLLGGGQGTIAGTVCGTAVLGILNNMWNMLGGPPVLQGLFKGVIILLAAATQKTAQQWKDSP